eukprot:6120937-Prymnesium_polylepis.1
MPWIPRLRSRRIRPGHRALPVHSSAAGQHDLPRELRCGTRPPVAREANASFCRAQERHCAVALQGPYCHTGGGHRPGMNRVAC